MPKHRHQLKILPLLSKPNRIKHTTTGTAHKNLSIPQLIQHQSPTTNRCIIQAQTIIRQAMPVLLMKLVGYWGLRLLKNSGMVVIVTERIMPRFCSHLPSISFKTFQTQEWQLLSWSVFYFLYIWLFSHWILYTSFRFILSTFSLLTACVICLFIFEICLLYGWIPINSFPSHLALLWENQRPSFWSDSLGRLMVGGIAAERILWKTQVWLIPAQHCRCLSASKRVPNLGLDERGRPRSVRGQQLRHILAYRGDKVMNNLSWGSELQRGGKKGCLRFFWLVTSEIYSYATNFQYPFCELEVFTEAVVLGSHMLSEGSFRPLEGIYSHE